MLRISQTERKYVEEGVKAGFRADGRSRLDYRNFTLESGIITQANGMITRTFVAFIMFFLLFFCVDGERCSVI